ncbi:MAG: metallophosphoesterase [bacterium]
MKRIIQISDMHCGSNHFGQKLMEKAIKLVNDSAADLLLITGDLTMEGYYAEYQIAIEYINRFKVP